MDPIQFQLKRHHSTPVFVTISNRPDLARVYGYTKLGRSGIVMFPAFLPFVEHVISDLEIVLGKDGFEWLDKAQEHLDYLREERERQSRNELPQGFSYVTKPFAHQEEGVVRALYEPRTGLFFDCGLGKTKTVIDLLRALKIKEPDTKTLICCPPHLVPEWEEQFGEHDNATLDVLTLTDKHGDTLPPDKRVHLYAGTRPKEPSWEDADLAKSFPDIVYTPAPPGTFVIKDIDVERAYLLATQREDQKEKSRLRAKMRRWAKKHDLEIPSPAKKVAPAPPPASSYDVVVLPYSILQSDMPHIAAHVPFTTLVCDESHLLRSHRSNRAQAVLKLGARAWRRYMLSGTPALGTPAHLYVQLSLLAKFLTGSWWSFYKRYCVYRRVEHHGKEHNEVVAYKALNVLNEIVTEVSLRKKAEDCLDLPPVRTLPYYIHVGKETRQRYNELVLDYAANIGGREVRVAHAADRLSKLQQILSGFIIDSQKNYELCDTADRGRPCPFLLTCAKKGIKPYTPKCALEPEEPPKITEFLSSQDRVDQCMVLLDAILASPDNKVIVWATFKAEIDMLSAAIENEGWDYVRVDGRTKHKRAARERFNNDPNCRIYLSQISTGTGVTLNAANYTVFFNATFDLSHYIQAQKRNDRIGQTRPVTVYRLVTRGSVNEYIFRALDKKRDISAALTDHIQCILCDRNEACDAAGVKPFDEDCIYSAKNSRLRMRPALLPED